MTMNRQRLRFLPIAVIVIAGIISAMSCISIKNPPPQEIIPDPVPEQPFYGLGFDGFGSAPVAVDIGRFSAVMAAAVTETSTVVPTRHSPSA